MNPGADAILDQVEAALADPAAAGEFLIPVKPPRGEMKQRVGGYLYGQIKMVMKNRHLLTPPQIERTRTLTIRMLVELFDMKEEDIDFPGGLQNGK